MSITKKILISIGAVAVFVFAIISIYLGVMFYSASQIPLDESQLKSPFSNIEVYNNNLELLENTSKKYQGVEFHELNDNIINAFIAVEDKRFFDHGGVDFLRLGKATLNNIRSMSFKEGASTISQQLVKNTVLTNEKTIDRKVKEIFLAKRLEKNYSKEEILSMYLSAIYFGNGQYGIKNASHYYFEKSPATLSLDEAGILAGLVKSPTKYSPTANYENSIERRNLVLRLMYENDFITSDELATAVNTETVITKSERNHLSFYNYVIYDASEKLGITESELVNGGYKIYTRFDENVNTILENAGKLSEYPTSIIAIDNETHGIIASYETKTLNGFYANGNPASLIKPILVYAPAIDNNTVSPLTLLNDVKTEFGNYSPNNYNSIYYGTVSMRTALEKSLNVPAVKVYNALTLRQIGNHSNYMGISISPNENMAFPLGGIKDGLSMIEIAGAYTTLADSGKYREPSFISSIADNNGNVLYQSNEGKNQVFKEETAFIISDMLKNVAKTGTAKTLGKMGVNNVSSKTGTNGTKNGNYEAYSVVYDDKYTVLVKIARDDVLLPNNILGGTLPTKINGEIFSKLPDRNVDNHYISPNVELVTIDKYAQSKFGQTLLASENTPSKYLLEEYISKEYAPTTYSTLFTKPTVGDVKLKVENEKFTLSFNTLDIYDYEISDVYNNEKGMVLGTGENAVLEFSSLDSFQSQFTVTPILKNNYKIKGEKAYSNMIFNRFALIP